MLKRCFALILSFAALSSSTAFAEDMSAGWSKSISATQPGHPDTTWFQNAKFGIFMHWGLYSEAGNVWDGKDYYGSGEWLMHQAKIPVKAYEKLAATFNPTHFNATDWATFIHDTGAKYLVITAKHHEGFAMFKSAASPYNIVDATPYHKDPMAPLADACRAQGIHFGFYYSQNLDWHEQNAAGNTWDFDKNTKDIKKYYAEKSIPQIKELLTNYGPLGIMWFDMPGGLSRDETLAFMANVRQLQPNCLISSRIGQGLGDFSDLGDSELPPLPIKGAWEALFTHTDSWGFQKYDQNFKTPKEVLRLLASTAARGGNLILNVGPDGEGNIPEKSREYLTEVGTWLRANGESIYGTTQSPFPDQPWGVATSKLNAAGVNHLYLHVLDIPHNRALFIPRFEATLQHARLLNTTDDLAAHTENGLTIQLPPTLPDSLDTVVDVTYTGTLSTSWKDVPAVLSKQFDSLSIDAANAQLAGNARTKSETSSRYFGNWKHDTVIENQQSPADTATFNTFVLEPGDYRLILEYANDATTQREGSIDIDGKTYTFQTLYTGTYASHNPLLFIRHTIGIVPLGATKPGLHPITIQPSADGPPLFWLRRLILEPVK
jgi:alpha-L-fucosidase